MSEEKFLTWDCKSLIEFIKELQKADLDYDDIFEAIVVYRAFSQEQTDYILEREIKQTFEELGLTTGLLDYGQKIQKYNPVSLSNSPQTFLKIKPAERSFKYWVNPLARDELKEKYLNKKFLVFLQNGYSANIKNGKNLPNKIQFNCDNLNLDNLNIEPSYKDNLNQRCQEALNCMNSEAYLASIIMLGSIIEGLLLSTFKKHPSKPNQCSSSPKDKNGKPKKFSDWSLSEMIDVAHKLNWIQKDIKDFSHSLRDFRNLVHVKNQVTEGTIPDEDTCQISFQVVIAVVNDLTKILGKEAS